MTMAGAVSKRRRFRYPKELRRFKQTTKWATVAFPKAPIIMAISAAGAGIVKILIDKYSGWNKGTGTPTIEWSLDGSTGWTGVAAIGYTVGQDLLTTAAVATGVKFFRVKFNNTFGSGAVSNIRSVTVT